jgi:hypothetical protein
MIRSRDLTRHEALIVHARELRETSRQLIEEAHACIARLKQLQHTLSLERNCRAIHSESVTMQ